MWGYSAPVQTQWALVPRLVKGRNRQHRLAHIQAQLLYAFARFGSRASRSERAIAPRRHPNYYEYLPPGRDSGKTGGGLEGGRYSVADVTCTTFSG